MSLTPNGSSEPDAAHLAVISELARALGAGSTKLCEALRLVFGEQDERRLRAETVDRQLQLLVLDLTLPEGRA
jgi:hypothetical protein